MFPGNAKVAAVTPIDKKTDDKNSLLNFRPIKSLRKHTKTLTRGKNEQSIFPFYLCVLRIVQHTECAYKTY